MKTLQLKTLPFLLVELPEGYRITGIDGYTDGQRYLILYSDTEPERYEKLPAGCEWLGKLSELPEEWFADKIGRNFRNYEPQQKLNQQPQYDMFWVRCPDGTDKHFDTKDQCYLWALKMEFLTFLEKQEQVYLNGNPMQEPDFNDCQQFENPLRTYEGRMREYEYNKRHTFDPERTYIFTVKTEKQ